MRKPFPAKVRAAVLRRCSDDKGIPHCEECGAPGFVEIDHMKADGLDGPATIENAKALCKTCHGTKTHTHDRPIMAKADRQRKKHFLGRGRSSFACSRSSPFKKKIGGEVVRR
jgi:5-methylcytosine-specific restriction endonuclease McrA